MTRRITVFTVLTLLWCAMIFFLSSQPADESSQTSGVFADFIKTVFFPDFDKLSEARQQDILDSITFIVRKGAHFTAYGILGALAFQTLCFIKRKPVRAAAAVGFACFYASTDEFHQTFVAGRSGELRDVLVDTSGALLFVLLSLLVVKVIERYREKKMSGSA